ncbi:MAG: xanthine dehydrogenase family protein molybdopterin-binding subunit [Alphaproteobacteria bacterium]|nr:MAG: xanthine dehydrogenase family protein molybdopterin-binding subunit [Alphaproteobacteria bacterium]
MTSSLFTRRGVIVSGLVVGGGLAVGYFTRANRGNVEQNFSFNAWIKIAPDDIVTFSVHRAEMGQGVTTSLPMMLAEELDADWSKVRYEFSGVNKEYYNFGMLPGGGRPFGPIENDPQAAARTEALRQIFRKQGLSITVRSSSIIDAHDTLRPAGAAVRAMLIGAAAKKWGVADESLTTDKGWVMDGSGDRRASYGELADAAANETPPSDPPLKDPKNYRIVGTNVPRLDSPAKVNGSAQFGIDVTLPDMLYASVKQSPVFGAKVKNYNAQEVAALPGVEAVIAVGDDTVAVIANSTWRAMKAIEQLDITYIDGPTDPMDSATLFEKYVQALDDPDPVVFAEEGDVDAAFSDAETVVDAVYDLPFLAHFCMEPMNCTALVNNTKVEVWAPTQSNTLTQQIASKTAGVPEDNVTVHTTFLGGGFGRRAEADFVRHAVTAAMAVPGRPVKLTWSREQDVQHDTYRPAAVSRFRAGLDGAGNIIAFTNTMVSQSILASSFKRSPNSRGGDARRDRDVTLGVINLKYDLPNTRIAYVPWTSDVPVGYWRSVNNSVNCFFAESFIDELAHASNADPLDYRRGLLKSEPRMVKILDELADKSQWHRPLGPGRGRGMAFSDNHGTTLAEVVEISLNDNNELTIDRVVCVIDCGIVVHPDIVIAQVEGSIIEGLGAALYGEITLTQGRVDQSNFHDYGFMSLAQSPKIEVYLLPQGKRPGGVGEPAVPPAAPALTNAIFDATGKRIRSLPIKKHDFLII